MISLIHRYSEICPCPTFVDCSRPDLFSSFWSDGIPPSIFIIPLSGRCIGALVGHQTLQEALGGCRSDSSVWPGVPPLVRHLDQTCLKHEWIRINEHGFRSATRNRERIFHFLWICLSLSLSVWIRFAFPLPWDPLLFACSSSTLFFSYWLWKVKNLVSPNVCRWMKQWNKDEVYDET